MLDADVDAIDRDAFRKIVGLKHLNSSLLTVGYIMAPSLINLRVDTHPDRKDVATIDLSRVERVLTLMPGENRISGHENLKRLKATGKTLLDVRVLEELLKNPHLIPEEWKNGITYFWGTIFCGSGGVLCVAFLRWGAVGGSGATAGLAVAGALMGRRRASQVANSILGPWIPFILGILGPLNFLSLDFLSGIFLF